jgi:hypothetical protein
MIEDVLQKMLDAIDKVESEKYRGKPDGAVVHEKVMVAEPKKEGMSGETPSDLEELIKKAQEEPEGE